MIARMTQRQLSLSFKTWVDAVRVRVALKHMAKDVCQRLMQWRIAAVFTHWRVTGTSHGVEMCRKMGRTWHVRSIRGPRKDDRIPCDSLAKS